MINVNHPILPITLAQLRPEHADSLFSLIDSNREYLSQHLGWLERTKTPTDALSFIQYCAGKNVEQSSITLGIFHGSSLIGIVGFHELDTITQKSSMGYWLAERYQGQGIMKYSVMALINYVISHLDITKITIRVALNNPRSQHIPETLGFEMSGIKKDGEVINGISLDQYVYQIERDKWLELHVDTDDIRQAGRPMK